MRHLRNLLTSLSLLLCLFFLLLWLRSYWSRDWARVHRVSRGTILRRDRAEMLTHPGVLLVNYYRTDYTLDAKNPTPGFRERLAQDDGVRWDTLVPLQPWSPPGPTTRAKRMGSTSTASRRCRCSKEVSRPRPRPPRCGRWPRRSP